ncbi:MAG: SMP-30/gluconolactonase/LRE family protein [Burkholderiales bacterium]|nr:SMP-30/gluconolactonase/LRE family protein [Burkholderiales bacterium]
MSTSTENAVEGNAVEILDPAGSLVVRPGTPLTRLCSGAVWSEGPVWMQEDDSVLWSDIPNDRMLRWSERDGMTVWRSPAGFTNGHAREADGSLLHCSHGQRAIVRTRFGPGLAPLPDEIVVDRYRGLRLNSPNDVVVKRDGSIWFTDPPYGILSDREGHQAPSEQSANHVFRFDPATGVLAAVTAFVDEPNGLAFSPDESILYVSDTSAAVREDGGGNHHIVAFDVRDGASLANPRVFAVIEPGLPDGMRVDVEGRVLTSSGDSVQVFDPSGVRLAKIRVPEKVGNLCFGGADRDLLYVCASTSLYRIRLATRGAS